MLVSVFTDASHDSLQKVAGWGAWAKSERGDMRYAGTFKESVKTSTEAEVMAMCNGLHVALKSGVLQSGDVVLLQSDCTAVIELVERGIHEQDSKFIQKRTDVERSALDVVVAFLQTNSIELRVKHVKGHKRLSSCEKRHHVNRTTDRLAKLGLEFARKGKQVPEAQALRILNSTMSPIESIINVQRLLKGVDDEKGSL